MGRRVRHLHLAKSRIGLLVRRLKASPITEWPEHFKRGYQILQVDLEVSERVALKLILDSASVAQVCAESINQWSADERERALRARVRNSLRLLANCCKRARATMRDSLDAAVGANLHLPADLEVIEGVFDSVAAVFMQHANDKTAATALGAMVVSAPGRETYNWLKSDYSGLRPEVQRSYEASLAKIGRKNHTVSAFTVFAALASGFDGEVVSPQRAYPEVTVILQNYVAEVTDLWRAQGLHPTRATHPENPEYKSRFHVFVDLILSAVAEPWTDRYTGDVEELRNKAAEVRASLPDDIRKECAIMRQYNSGLLISEDILRKGLKRSIQKPAQKTP